MDIYRFFHPQHNPRLLGTPLRQQELGEMEQVASELLRVVKRAWQRSSKSMSGNLKPTDFANLIEALHYCTSTLAKICDKHPGDTIEDLEDMIAERSDLPAWSNWARLVKEQIALGGALAESRQLLESQEAAANSDQEKINFEDKEEIAA